ncbi:helix-turn-helix domain-containing protein [Streptomyces sp. CB00455]|uniref:helix-turn-helix domain-containing protein n=1 Tax=Streptomyces sp. CB00455 TaxID=1703927 RepID=UPI0013013D70|nr:helix-turn-helix domain-containing protein [Streptomyces sp. CB00455]
MPKILCLNCKSRFYRPKTSGRPPKYCGTDCRRAAYRARQKTVLSYSQKHDEDVARIAKSVSARAAAALQRSQLPLPARPLELLKETLRLERDVADLKAVAVRQASEYGASWTDISHALSMSVSATRARYSDEQVAKILHWRAERGSGPGHRPPRPRPARPTSGPNSVKGESTLPSPALPGDPAYQLTTALSHLHRASGRTQRWLAAEIGISASLLSLILLGKRRPKWKDVKAMAELCGADPADLRPLWEKALGIPPVALPGPEDFLQAASSLKSALRGMCIAAGSPTPDDICFQHLTLNPRRVARALVSERPERDLSDWPFVAALATALRGHPDDVRPLWQRMMVASALMAPPDTEPHPANDVAQPTRDTASTRTPHEPSASGTDRPRLPDILWASRTRRGDQDTDAVMRRLGILEAIRSANTPVGLAALCRSCGLPPRQTSEVLAWLRRHHFITTGKDGGHSPGPTLNAAAEGRDTVQEFLEHLSLKTHGAIYIGSYTDGDIHVSHEAAQPGIPTVHQYVDFRESAHASALGKANLAQLGREARLDHLSRYRPKKLTGHTITDPDSLFRAFDLRPLQYDFKEYSDQDVCAASPLILPGRTACIAVAVPATDQRHRLIRAAATIKGHDTTMALSLTVALALNTTSPRG